MQHTFTLYEDAWIGSGQAHRRAVAYRVSGLPNGTTARIENFGAPRRDEWRIMRINADNSQSNWTGCYPSIQEALEALEHESQ